VGGCSSSGGTVSGSGGSSGSGGNNSSSGGSTGSGGSSNGSGGTSSSGGSTGSGGTSSSGGSTGSGGSSSGSGGDSGSGSGGSTATTCTALTDAMITDFSSTGQVGTLYKGAESDLTPPDVTTDGSLVININTGTSTMMYPYAYVGLPFNGGTCVDVSKFTGVTFKASGTLSDKCTIQFSTTDAEHNKVSDGGTCTLDSCYPSAYIFTLSSDPTDVTVKFTDQTGGGADPSAAVVDPKQVKGIQWQINPPAMGMCTGTVTIDDVKFVE